MNPALVTAATFTIGVLCGYILKSKLFFIKSLLGIKSNKPNKDSKPAPTKNPKKTDEQEVFNEETSGPASPVKILSYLYFSKKN